jgi:hypothetical protein
MSYHERRAFASLIITILISAFYFVYVFQKYPAANSYSAEVFRFWGSSIFILIPLSIVAEIVVQIVFSIVNTIATNEKESSVSDERDKLIQLRALRNSLFVFVFGFFLAMGSLVIDMTPSVMFIVLFFSGFVSGMVGYISQLYFYRKGF